MSNNDLEERVERIEEELDIEEPHPECLPDTYEPYETVLETNDEGDDVVVYKDNRNDCWIVRDGEETLLFEGEILKVAEAFGGDSDE